MEDEIVGDPVWRQNYSSIKEHASRVLAVLDGQSGRCQILKLPEAEARSQFPHLVVASLGAMREEKPGESSARTGACRWLERHTGEPAHTSPRSGALAGGFRSQEIHEGKGPQRRADLLVDC